MSDGRVLVYDRAVARVTVYDTLPALIKVYDGKQGDSAYAVAVKDGFVGTEAVWLASLVGPAGDSAYQVAVDEGFVGDKAAWLASLHGAASTVPGPSGVGVPTGGTAGQKLAKTSGVDFATGWVDDTAFVPKVTIGSTAPVGAGEFAWFQTDGAGNFVDLIVGTN